MFRRHLPVRRSHVWLAANADGEVAAAMFIARSYWSRRRALLCNRRGSVPCKRARLPRTSREALKSFFAA